MAGSFEDFERRIVQRELADADRGIVRYGGREYTHDQLSAALDLVRTPGDWKMPIDAVIPADADRDLIDSAITYFTGSSAEFTELPGSRLRVQAAGYYRSIGS